MTNLEKIVAACIKANPSIIVNPHAQLIGFDHKVTYFQEKRPIRLADILIAIEARTARDDWREPYWFGLDTDGHGNARFTHMYGDGKDEQYDLTNGCWNLHKDNLRDQSPEALAFLASIL